MTKKTDELARLKRKQKVSELRLRGQSLDAIHYALSTGKTKVLNPSTKKPYDRVTISKDIKEMTNASIAEIQANHEEHKGRQFAELQEVKRSAWSSGRLSEVLRALQMEMKLLGTEAPIKIDITIFTRLVDAIENTGQDANPVLEQMIAHLNSKSIDA